MNSKIKSNLRVIAIVAIALLMVTTLRTGISTAAMMPEETIVYICRATDDIENPYEVLGMSEESEDQEFDFDYNGPLDDEGMPGKGGDAWCISQRTVTPTAVTFTNTTCSSKGSYTVPTSAGVQYLVGDQVVEAGTYTVTAPANATVTARVFNGYYLQEDAVISWSYSFSAATNCQAVLSTTTTTPTPQVKVAPKGAVNAGGQGSVVVIGLAVSAALLVTGVALRKFAL
jgi:hypothetical protein